MRWLLYIGGMFLMISIIATFWVRSMISMPGDSYNGPFAPLSEQETRLRDELRADVAMLADSIGERNVAHYQSLVAADDAIDSSLGSMGYVVKRQSFTVDGKECQNIEAEIIGTKRPEEIVIVGGHYDSAPGTVGANDNATGVAATLAIARAMAKNHFDRTVRFVAFVNEEPPYFQTEQMGSLVYARRCRQRNENVIGMLSLETMGYYRDEPNSQRYPPPLNQFYPSTANFIGWVSNSDSKDLLHTSLEIFRRECRFPSEGAAAPESIEGVGWSDHWSFWQVGYPAIMITDTAPFRYPFYHEAGDTPEKIDYDKFARVVAGVERVVHTLANNN